MRAAECKPLFLINNGLARYHFHKATLTGNSSNGINTGSCSGTLPIRHFKTFVFCLLPHEAASITSY